MGMSKKKIFILGLDGLPYTYLLKIISSGTMPHFARLAESSHFQPINSVQPPVSSSAWASFLTGKQPHEHGILSFTERDPQTMDWYTPDALQLQVPTITEKLSRAGKRVFIMNVPVTYPAKSINGVSICGFLGMDLKQGVYPPEEADFLSSRGYKIDVDTELAKTDLAAFLHELQAVLEKRIEILWHYLDKEPWDFFMSHIMETDRLFHFTWEMMQNKDPLITKFYERFFKRIDELIGDVMERLDKDTIFMLLSDHGFTTLKQEVYLNRWLWENDYLKFIKPVPQSLHDIHAHSKAYSLYPGRIFINLKGREKTGSVNPGTEYEYLRKEIADKLSGLSFPGNAQRVIKEIKYGENLYPGSITPAKNIADLFAIAADGYDLKGALWSRQLFQKTVFNGMHSFDNAFLLINGTDKVEEVISVADIEGYILKALNTENTNS